MFIKRRKILKYPYILWLSILITIFWLMYIYCGFHQYCINIFLCEIIYKKYEYGTLNDLLLFITISHITIIVFVIPHAFNLIKDFSGNKFISNELNKKVGFWLGREQYFYLFLGILISIILGLFNRPNGIFVIGLIGFIILYSLNILLQLYKTIHTLFEFQKGFDIEKGDNSQGEKTYLLEQVTNVLYDTISQERFYYYGIFLDDIIQKIEHKKYNEALRMLKYLSNEIIKRIFEQCKDIEHLTKICDQINRIYKTAINHDSSEIIQQCYYIYKYITYELYNNEKIKNKDNYKDLCNSILDSMCQILNIALEKKYYKYIFIILYLWYSDTIFNHYDDNKKSNDEADLIFTKYFFYGSIVKVIKNKHIELRKKIISWGYDGFQITNFYLKQVFFSAGSYVMYQILIENDSNYIAYLDELFAYHRGKSSRITWGGDSIIPHSTIEILKLYIASDNNLIYLDGHNDLSQSNTHYCIVLLFFIINKEQSIKNSVEYKISILLKQHTKSLIYILEKGVDKKVMDFLKKKYESQYEEYKEIVISNLKDVISKCDETQIKKVEESLLDEDKINKIKNAIIPFIKSHTVCGFIKTEFNSEKKSKEWYYFINEIGNKEYWIKDWYIPIFGQDSSINNEISYKLDNIFLRGIGYFDELKKTYINIKDYEYNEGDLFLCNSEILYNLNNDQLGGRSIKHYYNEDYNINKSSLYKGVLKKGDQKIEIYQIDYLNELGIKSFACINKNDISIVFNIFDGNPYNNEHIGSKIDDKINIYFGVSTLGDKEEIQKQILKNNAIINQEYEKDNKYFNNRVLIQGYASIEIQSTNSIKIISY